MKKLYIILDENNKPVNEKYYLEKINLIYNHTNDAKILGKRNDRTRFIFGYSGIINIKKLEGKLHAEINPDSNYDVNPLEEKACCNKEFVLKEIKNE